MGDEGYTFEQTRARLEEILVQVKKKDTTLEQSLELLEEGVRLANLCNELVDQTSWQREAVEAAEGEAPAVVEAQAEGGRVTASEQAPGDGGIAENALEASADGETPAEELEDVQIDRVDPADDERD